MLPCAVGCTPQPKAPPAGPPPPPRLEGEPARAYGRFLRFLMTPAAHRSHAGLARELGITRQAVGRMASRWSWSIRASRWDEAHFPTVMQQARKAFYGW
jgi:hypothetical protein